MMNLKSNQIQPEIINGVQVNTGGAGMKYLKYCGQDAIREDLLEMIT